MIYRRIVRILSLALVLATAAGLVPGGPVLAVPIVNLSASTGPVGTTLAVSGSGFVGEGLTFSVHFAYGTQYEMVRAGTVAGGGAYASFFVPEVPAGTYNVFVETSIADSASALFTVVPSMVLGKTSAYVGTAVPVNGTGFGANKTVALSLDDVPVGTAVTNVNGSFSGATFIVPDTGRGSHIVTVVETANSLSAALMVLQSISVAPTSGSVGATVTVTGAAFSTNKAVTITYDNTAVTTSPAAIITTAAGSFKATLSVPSSFSGTHVIAVSDGLYDANANFSTLAGITLNPATGKVGSAVSVKGAGFGSGKLVYINFDAAQMATATTDTSGGFSVSFNVPASFSGTHQVVASDGGSTGNAAFATTASLVLNPARGPINGEVNVSGNGFLASKSVVISFANATVKTGATDTDGNFNDRFTVPQSASGDYTVSASDGVNTVSAKFTVSVSMSLSQMAGNVGGKVTASGTGFNGTIIVRYDDGVVTTGTADANGAFSIVFTVPVSIHGDHAVTVGDAVNTVRATFTVESTPPPAPSPTLPVNNDRTDSGTHFVWSSVTDPSLPVTYTLQIATNRDFAAGSVVLEQKALTSPEYALTSQEKLKPNSGDIPYYYWRVKATDAAANESTWSGTGSFYVPSFPDWARNALFGLGGLILAAFIFWLGRKTAPHV